MVIEDFPRAKLAELALFTGIHKSRWSRYFNRKQNLSEKTLKKIAVAFGVEPEIMLSAIQKRRQRKLVKGKAL